MANSNIVVRLEYDNASELLIEVYADVTRLKEKLDRLLQDAELCAQRTAMPVKAKVVCSNGHERVVEGKDFDDVCPECGAGIGEYDSRFGGE